MQELIKYFESLEARVAAYEARIVALEESHQASEAVIASLKAEIEELRNRPLPEPQVVEKIVEKPIEVIKEVFVEKPVEEAAPAEPEIPVVEEKPEPPVVPEISQTPEPEPEVSPEETGETPDVKEEEAAEKEPVASKAVLYGKPVKDIRQAISLGDRFLYQRELFGQNAELMQRTLTDIDGLYSFDEAISYIMTHFHWDTESSTYQQFLVTLHRRFG